MWRLRLAQFLVRALIEEKTLEILKTKYQWNQEKIKKYEKEIALITGGIWWSSEDPNIKQIKDATLEATSELHRKIVLDE